MALIKQCTIIRIRKNECQVVSITSKCGVTVSELKALQKEKGWTIKRIIK